MPWISIYIRRLGLDVDLPFAVLLFSPCLYVPLYLLLLRLCLRLRQHDRAGSMARSRTYYYAYGTLHDTSSYDYEHEDDDTRQGSMPESLPLSPPNSLCHFSSSPGNR